MPRTTKQQQKTLYLPDEVIQRWQQSAKKNHRSMNAEVLVALELYLDAQEDLNEHHLRVQDRTRSQ